jgi:hypothetical protein
MNVNRCIIGLVGALTVGVLPSLAADGVSLKVEKDGSVYEMVEKKISLQELHALAAAQAQKDNHATVLIFAADDVPLATMTSVMDTCRKAGINRFSLKTASDDNAPNQAAQSTTTAVMPSAGQPPREP